MKLMLRRYKSTRGLLITIRSNTLSHRRYIESDSRKLPSAAHLPSWNVEEFRQRAFIPQCPVKLPYDKSALPKAFTEWFTHEENAPSGCGRQFERSELKTSFWSKYESTIVPLELTSTTTNGSDSMFHRAEAPLKLLLDHLKSQNSSKTSQGETEFVEMHTSIYLAQCDLSSLPKELQDHLPLPAIVQSVGKGDLYSSSLWLGRPPTYTPLHRDPNPNLLLQLAGEKLIRLVPPELGDIIFEDVQERLAASATEHGTHGFHHRNRQRSTSASIRGEEMMQGPEWKLLHDIVWGCGKATAKTGAVHAQTNTCDNNTVDSADGEGDQSYQSELITRYGLEAHIKAGEALFIPKGWWHSVKGVGQGVTASANWWFR